MVASDRPVYLRLRDEIVAMILDGRIQEGEALPSVRAFAAEQGANPLTVAKAYQSFQDDGLVTVRRGVGMFVGPGAAGRLRTAARAHFLSEEWPEIASRIRRLAIDPADLLERVPV
ncbi:GntR family transcriptional regulator [Sphingomonas nostoxanthinifaciens]|uniref:GntR family transcriptional regulator n=1 Tax=Sphingomonas nostoxanthinifaciens TaxID=2872652 RepID=UPI001CC1DAEA|nr:GntR family transcriptional regulator [Sphingomonas nostoxanthinifaciens]UAK23361.1 GntR family transcriptional regulator [Sphingomonas nostoxanthinifaciens]